MVQIGKVALKMFQTEETLRLKIEKVDKCVLDVNKKKFMFVLLKHSL